MIRPKGTDQAHVLVVGKGDDVDEICKQLTNYGISQITNLSASSRGSRLVPKHNQADPLELISKDPDLFKSFDLVISVDQPRPFELALSDLRWPANGGDNEPDLPFIVTRNSSNACKFRCQYRELLVASTIQEQFRTETDLDIRPYLAVGLAFVELQESKGSWPGEQDKESVRKNVQNPTNATETKIQELVNSFCEKGLAGPEETRLVLARLITSDAVKLLTGKGQPINNTNIEEVYRIAARS